MNDLLDKFYEYKSISNYTIKYTLANGILIKFKLKQTDFPHLIGLHKLIDIPIIRQFNDVSNITIGAKYIVQKIKQQRILNENVVKNSIYYPTIQDRYMAFNRDNILSVTYTNAIIDFDASLIGSNLSSDYILFEAKDNKYNHLCVAKDSRGKRYAESFFVNHSNLYMRGQNIVGISKIEIFDENGNLYLSDNI